MKKALLIGGVAFVAALGLTFPAHAAPGGDGTAVGTAATQLTPRYGPKGKPPPIGGVHAGTPRALTYLYANAAQFGAADGAFAWYTVAKPTLAAGDFHTLAELAVQSADGKQIVEVGWTVDKGLFGDVNPRLFVFHWINGQPTCYNGCGFVRYAGGPAPGMILPTGTAYFTIRHFSGNWWIAYNNQWVGYYPDSRWNGTYTKSGLTQWFGEVAANSAAPCTDMGNGQFSSSASAAQIYNMGFWAGPAVNVATSNTHPSYYTATKVNAGSMRYGGPGAC